MNPNSPQPPDFFHKSRAHENRRQEINRKPMEKILFCEECSAPSLEEELYSGICVLCAGRQRMR